MTVTDVKVGGDYTAKFTDTITPVTLTEACEFGGWYGTRHDTGQKVRVTIARLIGPLSTTTVDDTTSTKEHTTMSTPTAAATAAKTARRSRRAANAPSNTPTAVTTTPTVKESTVSTIKVINTPKATPKRKPAAKRKPNKPVAAAPVETTITLTQAQLDALVAESVAKVLTMADAAKPAAVPTVKRAKPATVTVKLKMAKTTTNKVQFSYAGKEENPLVTSVYVNLPLVEKFTTSGAPVAVEFTTYVPRAKQKPQPKSKIRYTGSETTISDLYVDRALITKLGYTESNPPVVTVKVISDDEISLTFPKA